MRFYPGDYLFQGLLAGLVGLFGAALPAGARTWNIFEDRSGDAPTVQAGIDSAAVGDTVLVHPGTYAETITFHGKDIVVKSVSGPALTTLDAAGLPGRVVTVNAGESRAAVLEGLTMTHGQGGILIHNSQPSVIGNIISANGSVGDGGGILCGASTFFPWFPLIQGNVISENHANSLAGGIGTEQRMVPEVLDNLISDNEARDGDGGGIYYASFDNGAVIHGNVVTANRAGDHGGGIYVAYLAPSGSLGVEISWNLVSQNVARGNGGTGNSGGGIWLWETNAWVHHNTIVGNTGDGPNNAYGGGIVMEQPGSPIIEQNLIAFSTKGGGIWCGNGATPPIRNNLAWQNVGGNGVKDCANWWQSNGNVIDDPHFCDMAAGDFHVASNSGVMTHPAGPLGAFATAGCGGIAVVTTTWGLLKAKY